MKNCGTSNVPSPGHMVIVLVALIALHAWSFLGWGPTSQVGKAPAPGPAAASPASIRTVEDEAIVFFYDAHCPDCAEVKEALLEPFASRMGVTPRSVTWKDVTKPEVAFEILNLERRLGFNAKSLAPILVARGKAYCGLGEIRRFVDGDLP